ncbi:amidase [Prauserella marina]|uniref:Amidase n=1 Tax=Prauserella marina TaxID=530584 RepID=A0A222VIZ9_9PSEU|nr:amidase [Prauserella marina]ASR33906.1 amidase [Prauserella marina]PWV82503.1 amidase [Prauserella marina]SDC70721.1 amidase [Prauserella marina]
MRATERDIAFAGPAEQARLVAEGKVSAVELTSAALERAKRAQPTLNAFRHLRAREARREAELSDRRIAEGERAPLLGVPIAIKDDTDIAGLPTAFGCRGDFPVAEADAEVVAMLKRAGAVIIGKTNTPEVGQWPFTEGAAFGVTRNPWNTAYSPGGSSGGSAAAVAAGIVGAALGSDGAGSVRIPAAWTHLVGIKPQRGRIPTAPEPELFHGLTGHGPLARTVADAALLLDVAAGTNGTYLAAARSGVRRLRIGISLRSPFTAMPAKLDPRVRAAVVMLARSLTALGHTVVPVRPRYGLIGLTFLPRSLTGVADWIEKAPSRDLLDERTQANARTGELLRGILPLARRTEPFWRRRIGSVFADVDVLLTPTTATPPPAADTLGRLPNWRTDRAIVGACPYAWPWNVLGWPSVNVPAGFTENGLPMGAQLMGPSDSEELLIALAAQLETVQRWHDRTP